MSTIAVAVGEEAETLEEVHEPFLIQEGYLQRTSQGRILTAKGYQAIGLQPLGGAREIATRCRGTPRVANNLINFVRDYAQERAGGKITQPVASAALELLEIDAAGLDEMDKRMLRIMAGHYRGGPVGMSTIAVAVGEEAETLEEVHEPFLIQEGYLQRTSQGRVLTAKGYQAIGLQPLAGDQGTLL
jgi:Holliday junction DNA helicase RuvB